MVNIWFVSVLPVHLGRMYIQLGSSVHVCSVCLVLQFFVLTLMLDLVVLSVVEHGV